MDSGSYVELGSLCWPLHQRSQETVYEVSWHIHSLSLPHCATNLDSKLELPDPLGLMAGVRGVSQFRYILHIAFPLTLRNFRGPQPACQKQTGKADNFLPCSRSPLPLPSLALCTGSLPGSEGVEIGHVVIISLSPGQQALFLPLERRAGTSWASI